MVVIYNPKKTQLFKAMLTRTRTNKLKRYVKRIVNAGKETLAYDTVLSETGSTAGSISKITAIAQGDDINNRNGNIIKPLSQSVNIQITSSTVGTGAFSNFRSTIVRFIVFQDNHGDSTPTVSGTANTSLLAVASIYGNYNLDNRPRYKILYDKIHKISQASGITGFEGLQAVATIKTKKNVKGKMEFADTTGTLPAKGQIYFLQILDALATSQVVTLSGYTRLLYKEV